MLCRIFRPIDWNHSLVAKNFFSGVIQDLGPFLESSFCPTTQKRLFFPVYFRFWDPIIFQFPIRWPIHFFGGLTFFENFSYYWNSFSPFSSEFDAIRRNIFVLKNGWQPWRRFYTKYSHQNCGWRRDWRRKGIAASWFKWRTVNFT